MLINFAIWELCKKVDVRALVCDDPGYTKKIPCIFFWDGKSMQKHLFYR